MGQREQGAIRQLERTIAGLSTLPATVSTLTSQVSTLQAAVAALEAVTGVDVALIDNGDSPYALADGVGAVLADTSGGAVTVTFPAAADHAGRSVSVKQVAGVLGVTVDPNASETVEDAATLAITVLYESVTFVSDGTEWWIT